MTNHTSGNWGIATIDSGMGDDEIVTEVNGCLVSIASVFGEGYYSTATPNGENEPEYTVSKAESEANARLIAAAPELLAMLQRLSQSCDGKFLGTCKAPDWSILCEAETLIHKTIHDE